MCIKGSTKNQNLKRILQKSGRTRWLDIGSGGNFEKDFHYFDVFPKGIIDSKYRKRYLRGDIVKLSKIDIKEFGKFDLVRMQHVFEHLTIEEGLNALRNISELLNKDGYLLISVPDLKIFARKYLENTLASWEYFQEWSKKRIKSDAPESFYFSIFSHSMVFEEHKWCYDYEGLEYIVKSTNLFYDIQELKFNDTLASDPFTHSRPEEDVCLLAKLK